MVKTAISERRMQKSRLASGHRPAKLWAPTPHPGPPDGSNTRAQVHTTPSHTSGHTPVNSSYAGVCRTPLQGLPTSHQPAGVSYSNPAHQTLRLFQTSAIPAAQSKINWLEVIRLENVKSSFRGILKGGEMFQDTGVCPARYQSKKPETRED